MAPTLNAGPAMQASIFRKFCKDKLQFVPYRSAYSAERFKQPLALTVRQVTAGHVYKCMLGSARKNENKENL